MLQPGGPALSRGELVELGELGRECSGVMAGVRERLGLHPAVRTELSAHLVCRSSSGQPMWPSSFLTRDAS